MHSRYSRPITPSLRTHANAHTRICMRTPACTSAAEVTKGKRVQLGTQPIQLCPFLHGGKPHVFATSDRPTVIHASNHKFLFSNVNLPEVGYMCPVDNEAYPGCIALVGSGQLTIASLEVTNTNLRIHKIPIGESVSRICHQQSSGSFCILVEPGNGQNPMPMPALCCYSPSIRSPERLATIFTISNASPIWFACLPHICRHCTEGCIACHVDPATLIWLPFLASSLQPEKSIDCCYTANSISFGRLCRIRLRRAASPMHCATTAGSDV